MGLLLLHVVDSRDDAPLAETSRVAVAIERVLETQCALPHRHMLSSMKCQTRLVRVPDGIVPFGCQLTT